LTGGRERPTLGDVARREVVTANRQRDGGPCGIHVWKSPDGGERFVVKRSLLFRRLRARSAEEDVERQEGLRVDASVDMAQRREAAEEQNRADDERQRDGKLNHGERFTVSI